MEKVNWIKKNEWLIVITMKGKAGNLIFNRLISQLKGRGSERERQIMSNDRTS